MYTQGWGSYNIDIQYIHVHTGMWFIEHRYTVYTGIGFIEHRYTVYTGMGFIEHRYTGYPCTRPGHGQRA